MNRKELELVIKVLKKIKNPDTWVIEALHNCERDIARFDKMAKENRKGYDEGYDFPW